MSGMSNGTGAMLSRREHIGQSIADILTTPIGTRLMRRNYGSYLPQLVDHPATDANRLRLIAATAQAIIKWEPRTRVLRVGVRLNAQGKCQLSIVRRDTDSADTVMSTVNVGGAA
ncbi:GPW/gp25 family protein [Variovorax ureilyticus]|uniref:GPW/gp25 family protein n=1 Tax=Variovorax ureilyticus TaxID=1836198 RepID=UPI003D66F211